MIIIALAYSHTKTNHLPQYERWGLDTCIYPKEIKRLCKCYQALRWVYYNKQCLDDFTTCYNSLF